MAEVRSGLFTVNEFRNRNVLKYAPDGFIVINGSLGARVVSPINISGTQDMEIRGGVTSVSINAALNPSGASKANIEIIAPQYKGLHEDYYVTLPNGARIPYFIPMMEVKVYLKGQFLRAENNYKPQYYPAFWGLILDVTETYSSGVNTFSLSCGDLLSWWKHQKITLRPASLQAVQGAPTANKFATVFENMNPWEVVYSLFMDSYFAQKGTGEGFYNFIYAKFSKDGFSPDFGNVNADETFGALARDTITYWNKRFGFDSANPKDPNRVPLEMYGLRGPINVDSIEDAVLKFDSTARKDRASNIKARLNLDFNILARVQPYGAFDLYGDGSEPLVHSKLEIVNEVCEQTHMEFFLDTNGSFVFKPPFYNLDVSSESLLSYRIDQKDIINFTASTNSENIVNYLEVTSPLRYETGQEVIGYHMDYDSMKRYGIRYQQVAMRYGNDAKTLRLLAVAEMARINGAALTGSLSIPLRPELRLGYPVYVRHIDAFYYVAGITHNLTFGSSATTDLTLEFRRDKIFDDGTITKVPGSVLKGYVQRFRNSAIVNTEYDDVDIKIKELTKRFETDPSLDPGQNIGSSAELVNLIQKDELLRQSGFLAGPKSTGLYELSKARSSSTKAQEITNAGTTAAVLSNELVMVTDETAPFSDIKGYRHIGSFPYGANLKLMRTSELVDTTNVVNSVNVQVNEVLQINGNEDINDPGSGEISGTSINNVESTGSGDVNEPKEAKVDKHTVDTDVKREEKELGKVDPNPENNTNLYIAPDTGLNKVRSTVEDSNAIINIKGAP